MCSHTYVFDIWTRIDGNDIAMFDPEIVTNDPIHSCTPVIKVVLREDNEHSVLSLLSFDQDCITTEKSKSFHGVVGEADD